MLVAVPLSFLALLGVQVLVALRGEYLPDDPGYVVDARVGDASAGEPLRLAVLGDSTAAGLGSPTVEESLPVLVAQRVSASLDRPVHVMGYGVSGAVTADVAALQLARIDAFAPDVVLAVVGSNDVTHLTPPWRLRQHIAELGAEVADQLEAPLILAGIPLFGGATALAQPLRTVVDRYADVLRPVQREAAAEAGIGFVEIARDASPRFVGVPDAMSVDGFHPAPVGYGFWADAIAPHVVASAARPTP